MDAEKTTPLAWSGWRMRLPETLRPLNLTGMQDGTMLLGDGSVAWMQVKWKRGTVVDRVEAWMEKSARQAIKSVHAQKSAPPRGWSAAFLACDKPAFRDSSKIVWYGASRNTGLVLELVFNGAASPEAHRVFTETILPSIGLSEDEEYQHWAMWSAAFQSPRRFRLINRRLVSGDLTLRLAAPEGDLLLLRQVYPANLALSRAGMEAWASDLPFKRLGRRLERFQAEEKTLGGMKGLRRVGTRRIPPPLSFLLNHHVVDLIAHDEGRNRLLIASREGRHPVDENALEGLLVRMNRLAA